jgi:hypothetical protein
MSINDNTTTNIFYLDAIEDNWQRIHGKPMEELE